MEPSLLSAVDSMILLRSLWLHQLTVTHEELFREPRDGLLRRRGRGGADLRT